MKRSFLSLMLLLAACAIREEAAKLTGTLEVASFSMTGTIPADAPGGRRLVGALSETDNHFRFAANKKLHLSPKLGMNYFGDTVFNYRIINDSLFLSNKRGKRSYPFVNDGGMVTISNISSEIKFLILVRPKVMAGNKQP